MGEHRGRVVGYVRVSASDRNGAQQLEAIGKVDRLFCEEMSGKTGGSGGQLVDMLGFVHEGDLVRVKSPDRLARSAKGLLALVKELRGKGVDVEFVDNPELNTGAPQAGLAIRVLEAVAQMERATIRERQARGIAIARRKGVYDRGTKLTAEQIAPARRKVAEGVTKARVARDLGVSRQTLYAALQGTGRYAEVTS
jgi:DNA invertase Pin-like site-specific DNA recombinase